ncbi:hypothetical protein QE391_003202 [Pseudomonas fluorescens]|nr:hypothetical protein [Pseudomonas fluorescens]
MLRFEQFGHSVEFIKRSGDQDQSLQRHEPGRFESLENISHEKPVATTGFFLLGNQRRLTHRHHIIQNLIHRQFAQHDDLGDAEQGFALAAVEQRGEVAEHDAGRAEGFAGVDQ